MENINDWSYKYQEALKVLAIKLNALYQDYSKNVDSNPIEHIKYRIKTPKSMREKIAKKIREDHNFNIDENDIILTEKIIDDYLCDVVGVRIVCSFIDDLEELKNKIKEDKDLEVIEEKNYIDNPKKNGYKSYHLKVKVPVAINGKKDEVKAEIQLRTIAMDMCASVEHIIYYKKGIMLSPKTQNDLERTITASNEFDKSSNNYIKDVKSLNLEKEWIDLDQIPDKDFNNLLGKYKLALDKIYSKISNISEEYKSVGKVSPIEHINVRIKNKERIFRKLLKQGLDINLKNIEEYISDIAAIRIVCPFKENIYEVIDKIKEDNEIEIIKEKDYITTPKASGYRSYHLIALVPIYTEMGKIYIKTETI